MRLNKVETGGVTFGLFEQCYNVIAFSRNCLPFRSRQSNLNFRVYWPDDDPAMCCFDPTKPTMVTYSKYEF